mmetsp:Transcript_20444/g.37101  ORF Transcript_20444/g.37101 Transcript_20444/m.37101 type:complete len:219 (+) Transcript_20444:648-1304(+)
MRPVDFVGLTNLHTDAMFPFKGRGEFLVILIVVAALESFALLVILVGRSRTILVELSGRIVLSSKMPMDVDWAQANLTVWDRNRHSSGVSQSNVSLGDVGTSLLTSGIGHLNLVDDASNIGEIRLLPSTWVGSKLGRGGGRRAVGDVIAIHSKVNRRDEKSKTAHTKEDDTKFHRLGHLAVGGARSSGRLLDRTLFSSHHSTVSLQTFIEFGRHVRSM